MKRWPGTRGPRLRRYMLVCDSQSRWTGLLRFETQQQEVEIEAIPDWQSLAGIDWQFRRQADFEQGRFCDFVFLAVNSGTGQNIAAFLAENFGRDLPPVGISLEDPNDDAADGFRRLRVAAIFEGLVDLAKVVQTFELLRRQPVISPLGFEQSLQASLPWFTPKSA